MIDASSSLFERASYHALMSRQRRAEARLRREALKAPWQIRLQEREARFHEYQVRIIADHIINEARKG
jgi:hypothetical protein